MMQKFLFLSVLLILASCTEVPKESITEAEVVDVVEKFFDRIDVANENRTAFKELVTEDFLIYELGQKMTKEEFGQMIAGLSGFESTNWELSDVRVSTDHQSAHISLKNTGKFIFQTDSGRVQQDVEWLESAYLVKDATGDLKIKFYFSDNIRREARLLAD